MRTQQRGPSPRSDSTAIVLSVPAVILWSGVSAFLVKWSLAWEAGRLQPALGTSWSTLYAVFGIATLAVAVGFCLTLLAWMGRSTVRWQLFSVVLGVLFLWAVAGH